MNYSEWLNIIHKSKVSPEMLGKMDNIESQIHPDFKEKFNEYRDGVLELLSKNELYADDIEVRNEIMRQNKNVSNVFWINAWKNKVSWAIMQAAANDEDYSKVA